jgi:hypothetical protein
MGKSVNATILDLLKTALGINTKRRSQVYHDLDALSGSWSGEDEKAFRRATQPFNQIDEELWK